MSSRALNHTCTRSSDALPHVKIHHMPCTLGTVKYTHVSKASRPGKWWCRVGSKRCFVVYIWSVYNHLSRSFLNENSTLLESSFFSSGLHDLVDDHVSLYNSICSVNKYSSSDMRICLIGCPADEYFSSDLISCLSSCPSG